MKPSKLISLSLQKINGLGQDALTAHERCIQREKFTCYEQTEFSVKCKRALDEQRKWIDAIIELITD